MDTDANAPGGNPTLSRIRGLDGIRALSVLAIIAFHTGLSSVPGGFYGVDSFFVLSGFLITSLLVKEWAGTGTIRLRRFWAGRARRLLPALFLLVAVIGIVLAVVPRILATPHILGDAALGDLLCLELVLHSCGCELLHAVLPAVAPAAHVVARDRGAVLPGLAAGGARGAQARDHIPGTTPPAARRTPRPAARHTTRPTTFHPRARRRPVGSRWADPRPGRPGMGAPPAAPASLRCRVSRFTGLRAAHGAAGPQRVHQPRLLRHGHPRPGVAGRCRNRHRAGALARGEQPPLVHPHRFGARPRRCRRNRRAVGHDLGDLDVRLQRWVHVGQPGGGRGRPRLRGGAPLPGGPPPGSAAPSPRGSDLLRHLPLVLACRSRHERATAAFGPLPALRGPRRRHRRHRRRQLRSGGDADPPRGSDALGDPGWRRPSGRRSPSARCASACSSRWGRPSCRVRNSASVRRPRSRRRPRRRRSPARSLPCPPSPARGRWPRPPPRRRPPGSSRPRFRRRPRPNLSRCCWSGTPLPARSAWVWPRRRGRTTCRSSTRGPPAARSRCRPRSVSSSTR